MATLVHTGTQSTAAAASSLTTNSPSAAGGNTLVLEVSWALAAGTSATPGTPAGWTKIYAPLSSTSGSDGAAGYALYTKVAAGGVESPVFASPDASSNLYAHGLITEWSGMGAHDTQDSSATVTDNTGGASTGVTVPNTGTLTSANSTIFTGLAMLAGSGLANAAFALSGGTWTADVTDNDTSASVGSLLAHKVVSANTALGAIYTWTSDSTILCFQAAVVVFSDSGGGGGTVIPGRRHYVLP